jgi:hypothetical protein
VEEAMSGWKTKTPDPVIHEILTLRHQDGLSARRVAVMLGISQWTVLRYAPGRPGKVPVAPLREAFLASPLTAAHVARQLGWWDHKGSGDATRVKHTLGLLDDVNGHGIRSRRTMVDAETVMQMAEAIGVSPWAVLPEEES